MISKKNSFINEFVQQINDVKSEDQNNKLFKYLVILGINAYTSAGQALTYFSIKRWAKTVQRKNKKDLQDQVSQLKQQIKTLTQNVSNTLSGGANWINGKDSTQPNCQNPQQISTDKQDNASTLVKDGQKGKKMNFEGLDIQEINRLFYENIEQRNQVANKQVDNAQNKQEDSGPLQQVELNSILSPKNTQKKMSFANNQKSHSIHAPSSSNATTARRINENLHLNSLHITQSQYPSSLEQSNPLTSCKNGDKGQLKLQDFQSPPSLVNSEFGLLSNKNTHTKQLTQIMEKNIFKNKENNSYFGNFEGKENVMFNSQFEDKKRKSCSPLKSSQNNLVQSQNSNCNSQILNKRDSKNDSTSRGRKGQHKKNLNMYKQPCQKLQANRSRSSNPSRSNSRTPRNSKSPAGTISFNGGSSMNQVPSYLRNVQSKIKDQIEFHKELKKNETKLGESQQNHLNPNPFKQNQDYNQSQGISPSHKNQSQQGQMSNQNYFQSQNLKKETSSLATSSLRNPNQNNNLFIMDNFQNQSKTMSTLSNNSTKNSNTPFNKLSQINNNNSTQDQLKSIHSLSTQNNHLTSQKSYPLNSMQQTQGTTLQTSSHHTQTLQQQSETLFTGHFRTKSNISEYQPTFEDQHSVDNHHASHSNLRHNQIKNMYIAANNQNQFNNRTGQLDNSQVLQHQSFRSSLERNKAQNPSPQRQRVVSVISTSSNIQQPCISPSNAGGQSFQKSFIATRECTPNGGRRQSGGALQIDHLAIDKQENKNYMNNPNISRLQDQSKSQGKKNVLELATNFLKSPLMQQLCSSKQNQQQTLQNQSVQSVQQNQQSYSNLMNGNIKQQHLQQSQNEQLSNSQLYFSDNQRGFVRKSENMQKEIQSIQQNSLNSQIQQQQQPSMSIQEQLQEQMKKFNSFPKKHPCDETLSPLDLQQLLVNQNPNLASNYQSANFGNSKNYQSNQHIGQGQLHNINIQHNYCSSGNNPNNNSSNQAVSHLNGDQSMVASSLFSSFNPNNETKGFFQNDFEKRMNDIGKSGNSRKQQLSQNDASSNISFNAGDMTNHMIQPQVENPFY